MYWVHLLHFELCGFPVFAKLLNYYSINRRIKLLTTAINKVIYHVRMGVGWYTSWEYQESKPYIAN